MKYFKLVLYVNTLCKIKKDTDFKTMDKSVAQLQSKSPEMCSDTSLTLLGTSPTSLIMIMI